MKLIIDIPGNDYELALRNDYSAIYKGTHIAEAVKNGLALSRNPTNGDMILSIFETAQVYGSDNETIKVCIDNNYYQTFDNKWWNTPYC